MTHSTATLRFLATCFGGCLAALAACSAADDQAVELGAHAPPAEGGGGAVGGQSGLGGEADPLGQPGMGGGDDGACAEATLEVQPRPVSMYIAVDKSGSMDDDGKWDDAEAAFGAFFVDPSVDALQVALRFWPRGDCNEDECDPAACKPPDVALGSLSDPSHEQALLDEFADVEPDGATPMSAALAGAELWAEERQQLVGDGEQVVVVLLTDGDPNGCSEDIGDIAQIAADALGDAGVLTFAVGLQGSNEADMDSIATAGGSEHGYFIGAGDVQADLIAALGEISKTAIACNLALPEPPDPSTPLDPSQVNVTLTPLGAPAGTTVPQVASAAECPASGGWYYDDATAPTQIELCDASCALLEDGATLELVLGCDTVVL